MKLRFNSDSPGSGMSLKGCSISTGLHRRAEPSFDRRERPVGGPPVRRADRALHPSLLLSEWESGWRSGSNFVLQRLTGSAFYG